MISSTAQTGIIRDDDGKQNMDKNKYKARINFI